MFLIVRRGCLSGPLHLDSSLSFYRPPLLPTHIPNRICASLGQTAWIRVGLSHKSRLCNLCKKRSVSLFITTTKFSHVSEHFRWVNDDKDMSACSLETTQSNMKTDFLHFAMKSVARLALSLLHCNVHQMLLEGEQIFLIYQTCQTSVVRSFL